MNSKRSILNKLILNGFVTVIISFLITGTILFGMAASSVQIANKEKSHILKLNAQRISEFSIDVFSSWSPLSENYKRTLNTISQSIDAHIIIFDSNSQIVAVGGLDESKFMWKTLTGKYVDEILKGKSIDEISTIQILDNENLLTVGIPIKSNISYGGVLVSAPSVSVTSAYSNVLKQYGMSALFSLLIAFVLFYFLSKKITEPIKAMNNAVIEFSRGNFNKRISCNTKDELATLADNINNMAESIENLEGMRSGFISNISHELRTPMTSITGFVEGMIDGTIPPHKHKDYLEIVHSECKRLARLVDDLLKISRLDNGKLTLKKRIFNINETLRRCLINFENDINKKDIQINAEFENENTNVYADADAITQVITNIIHNAVKFTQIGGEISIKTFENQGKIFVEIKNTGIGISEEKIKYIWDRFYKEDASRGDNPEGLGLGLYIAKSILNQHKQQITATSKEGEYASFVFTLSKPQLIKERLK